MTRAPREPADVAFEVLAIVRRIPRGKVLAYGDIAELVGTGPRQVGRILSTSGGGVPWQRVVRADGTPALCHDGVALACLRAEGTPLRGTRVDMTKARWTRAH